MILKAYKPDQGRAVRYTCYLSMLVLVLWASVELYDLFDPNGPIYDTLFPPLEVFGVQIQATYMLLICAGLFLAGGAALFIFFQRPRVAEFLIETQGELSKVSWPERKEYVGASVAVVILVVFIVVYLYAVDVGLSNLLTWWKIGF